MRKWIALLLVTVLLLPVTAMAEFDVESLLLTEGCYSFEDPGSADTVVRQEHQPFAGELEEGMLSIYVDYLIDATRDVTFIRLLVSTVTTSPVYADGVTFTVGGKTYAFPVKCEQYEYDGIYYEDYYVRLTDKGLPLLKSIAQQKKDDPIPVSFTCLGEAALTGVLVIPGNDAAFLYDRYIDLGGKTQELALYDEDWPCEVQKK